MKLRTLPLSPVFPLLLAFLACSSRIHAQELSWAIAGDPHTLDPAQVEDGTEETVRYLTGGVLIRMNRQTQEMEPALAEKWSVSPDGKTLTFTLRPGLHFSDGSPLTAKDVAATLHYVLMPKTQSPQAEGFIQPEKVVVETPDATTVRIKLPLRIVTYGSLFDEIAIQPDGRLGDSRVTAGIYSVDNYQRGQWIHLRRNEHYWKHESAGVALAEITGIKLAIMANRDEEVTRFRRGQLSLIDALPPEYMTLLDQHAPYYAHDNGPSLDTEQLWFNQSPTAPISDAEKAWFGNAQFRVAIAQAIHRADLVRIAFDGYATVAGGFISPANTRWRNMKLQTPREDTQAALQRLHAAGFQTRGALLYDSKGRQVTFSLLTNAGNRERERMASLIQQDLAALGIRVNIVTLDFPALVERLMQTHAYEACLLGIVNVQPDPATGANVWLSSSEDHQWSPRETHPSTPWEAEIDGLILKQASTTDFSVRKQSWDRIQQIVADQQPLIYLVHRDVLFAAFPSIQGIHAVSLRPQVIWNIDTWKLSGGPHGSSGR